jgi:hypothetical protein
MTDKLTGGDTFPSVALNVAGGGQIKLPEDLSDNLTIVLFYRGYW